jgi:copper chaperone CopZ
MTCAHIVDVALKRMPGVDSVEVSLNKGLAIVKLKPGNRLAVAQFWQVLHDKGYSPKATTIDARGVLAGSDGSLQFQISGTNEVIPVIADPKHPAAYQEAVQRVGQDVTLEGVMIPGKNLKAPAPLQVHRVIQGAK